MLCAYFPVAPGDVVFHFDQHFSVSAVDMSPQFVYICVFPNLHKQEDTSVVVSMFHGLAGSTKFTSGMFHYRIMFSVVNIHTHARPCSHAHKVHAIERPIRLVFEKPLVASQNCVLSLNLIQSDLWESRSGNNHVICHQRSMFFLSFRFTGPS